MQIINYKCDMCGYEKIVNIPTGGQYGRHLWRYGRMEVCDVCSEKIAKIVDKELMKAIKEKNNDDY